VQLSPTHLWQHFINRIGPVRPVFCKADTPPNRSPPHFLPRWAGQYINRSSAFFIQSLCVRGFRKSRCSRIAIRAALSRQLPIHDQRWLTIVDPCSQGPPPPTATSPIFLCRDMIYIKVCIFSFSYRSH
jgi:hypothetical protein